jgi:hypothetical protein
MNQANRLGLGRSRFELSARRQSPPKRRSLRTGRSRDVRHAQSSLREREQHQLGQHWERSQHHQHQLCQHRQHSWWGPSQVALLESAREQAAPAARTAASAARAAHTAAAVPSTVIHTATDTTIAVCTRDALHVCPSFAPCRDDLSEKARPEIL